MHYSAIRFPFKVDRFELSAADIRKTIGHQGGQVQCREPAAGLDDEGRTRLEG